MEANFNPAESEKKLWDFWMQGGWFNGEVDEKKTPYSIIIPPPNVTDRLHMGHGLNNTIQDILIRWKRMSGYNCSWLPGTDHAGIATQMMVEKSLKSEGVDRKSLGRDKFLEKCREWKDKNGGIIIDQLKRLGASCDWPRQAYTMDPTLSKAVRKIFVDLYRDGLIYRGERLVNWDPVLKTAISDDEVENNEISSFIYHFKYPLLNVDGSESTEEFVEIATTRPETMLGDTAVAVAPDDERYKDLVGRFLVLPFTKRHIPIVADEYVKSEFGTGCVKVTPAHDPNDYEIGKRHNLPMLSIMNEDGTLNDGCPEPFRGKDRFDARKLIIEELKKLDLFVEKKSYKHTIPHSERSKVPIEPMLSPQWYVKMKGLAEPAIKAAYNDEITFYPSTWKKTYLYWLENIQDWCISRQLWWGHRIPIWYCGDCSKTSTGMEDPTHCEHCQGTNLTQDEDVLDTWFSSWLWPISPYGWPEESKDLDYFFPSQVLVTGPDIIYLWVARMIMASYYTKGRLPFKDVYFNAIICDNKGQKFSKTLGNGIDPIEVINKHGADAVRYTCVSLASLGGRVKMDVSDFENGGRFIHKIWNAGKFLLRYLEDVKEIEPIDYQNLPLPMKWLLQEFKLRAQQMDQCLNGYHINEAVEAFFHLTWRGFCDWGLEVSKELIKGDEKQKAQTLSVLTYVFEGILRLGSPILPFISEELWQHLPKHPEWERPESLVVAVYPLKQMEYDFSADYSRWSGIQDLVTAVRSARTQAVVPPKDKVDLYLQVQVQDQDQVQGVSEDIAEFKKWLKPLAHVGEVFDNLSEKPQKCTVVTGKGWTAYLPLEKYMDYSKEKKRLESEFKRVEKIVKGLSAKLGNKRFVDNAPADVIEQTKSQFENMNTQLKSLQVNLEAAKDW